jgi:HEAT repeat protein
MKKLPAFIIVYAVVMCRGAMAAEVDTSEKAIRFFTRSADYTFITQKCGNGSGVLSIPGQDPFYTFIYKTQDCPAPVSGVYVFHLDPKTGTIWLAPETQTKVSALRDAETKRLRRIQDEKAMREELRKISDEFERPSFGFSETDVSRKAAIKKHTPLLLQALKAQTPEIRGDAARLLDRIARLPGGCANYKITGAIPGLVALLNDEDYGNRYEAAAALGDIGTKDQAQFLMPLLKDTDCLVRRSAVTALGKLGDSSLVPVFLEFLRDNKCALRQNVVVAFARIGDERVIAPLVQILPYAERAIQSGIIEVLKNKGDRRAAVVLTGLFNRMYNDKHANLLMGPDAVGALVNIGKDAVPPLVESLKSPDARVRLYAAYALGLIKAPVAIGPLSLALTKENDPAANMCMRQAVAAITMNAALFPIERQIRIWVEPAKPVFDVLDTVTFAVYVQNIGSVPILLFNEHGIFFTVKDSDRQFLSPRNTAERKNTVKEDTYEPARPSPVLMNPGQVHRFDFSLDGYEFRGGSAYTISAMYRNSSSGITAGTCVLTGKLEAAPAHVKVKLQ